MQGDLRLIEHVRTFLCVESIPISGGARRGNCPLVPQGRADEEYTRTFPHPKESMVHLCCV